MARTLAPTFVPTNSTSGGVGFLPLESIPEEIKQEVEATYAGLKANPNGRMTVAFDTVEELEEFANQVRSYCAQRTDGQGNPAAIRFRKSPTRGLPPTQMDYRISDLRETPEVPAHAAPVAPVVPAKATPAVTRRR